MATHAGNHAPCALRAGDHVRVIYDSPAEHARILAPYMKAGLELGEKVVYLADYTSGATVMDYLRDAGVDVDPRLRSGQLSVLRAAEACLPDGAFQPTAMIDFLAAETRRALAEGFAGLRATGEMTWVLEGRPGCDRVLEYESQVNAFFGERPNAIGLCQYRRSRFDPKLLLEILKTHPVASVGAEFYENPFYIPPNLYLGSVEPDAMLDRCLAAARQGRRFSLTSRRIASGRGVS